MALSDDQRALLRLLAQREQGYEDIAALQGRSVDEVRAEVRAALAELDAGPGAEPAPPRRRRSTPRRPAIRLPRRDLPPERRRLVALAGAGLLAVAAAIGAIALLGGDSGSATAGGNGAGGQEVAAEGGKVTQAVLRPVGGGDAEGRAIFGRVGQQDVVLQVTATGLEPTAEGESYTVWLFTSPKLSLRVGGAPVGENGRLGAQLPIPAELLAYVAGGAFKEVRVSRTSDAAYRREVRQAKRQNRLPRYSGETVLGGEITGPLAEASQGSSRR